MGNLSFNASQTELEQAFAAHGAVTSVYLATDRETGRSRGFAFVEMASAADAEAARKALDGSQLGGRPMRVSIAQPREDRAGRSGRSGRWSE